ncbi:MAG: hypothetical protein ING66_16450 [Rhodocyclaceae bacterium]|jgi:hypothetical protein|nr:hypothetical protein [Rhodocyclaceae bacterium]MCA3025982.1 hypothetical protein [Rhodocyclaceae bacterium]MCA3030175.1 hypothetical protein [Rhodocyclaceae bacterium]MCA3033483.1 hypothetical protein [Rhodocyclaceae bacterium]MCA3033628.1 hypothetical protein [Rhodocyclaceae bacterium]
MKPQLRMFGAGLVLLSLAAASVASVRLAIADESVSDINGRLYEADKMRAETGMSSTDTAWQALLAKAQSAVHFAPHNGHYWNALARVQYLPRMMGEAAVSPDYAAIYQAYREAVLAQPSSAYAWSGLAYASDYLLAQNQLPGGKAALEKAIERTIFLGQREPHALRTGVDLGLANWPLLVPATKQMILGAVKRLAQHHLGDVAAIAERRGALPTVCVEAAMLAHQACNSLNGGAKTKVGAI